MKKKIAILKTGFMDFYLVDFCQICKKYGVEAKVYNTYEEYLPHKDEYDYLLSDQRRNILGTCNVFHHHSVLFKINLLKFTLYRFLYFLKVYKRVKQTREIYPKLTKLIMVSSNLKEDFAKNYNISDEKFLIVRPGIELNQDNSSKVFQKYDGVKPFVVSMSGVGFITKGGYVMLRAMRYLRKNYPEMRVVANIIYPKSKSNLGLQLYMWFWGLHDRVNFFDRQNGMEKFYRQSNCFICPSLYEAFGRVVPEAMYEKVPVIVGEHIGAADILIDSVNGFIYKSGKDSAKNLAEKIKEVYDKYNDLEDLVERAYETSKKITWKNFAQQVFDGLYGEITK